MQISWLSTFYGTEVINNQISDCRNIDFRLFCSCDLKLDPMTFIYELDMYGDTPDVQIWTSYVKAFESYRLTDRHTCTYIQTDRQDCNSTSRRFADSQNSDSLHNNEKALVIKENHLVRLAVLKNSFLYICHNYAMQETLWLCTM